MLRKFPSCLFAVLAAHAAAVAQDPVPPKGPDPEVAAKIEVLKECAADKKLAREAEGIEAIDFLLQKLRGGLIDKDVKAVTKTFETLLMRGKVRPPDNLGIYIAAVAALGSCGDDGAEVLKKAYDNKRFPDKKEWVPLREEILKSVGKTKAKDDKTIKFLLDEARRSPEDALMRAAGEALGNYEDADEAVRKEIVSDLIKRWGEVEERASRTGTGDIQAGNARNTLSAISGKWNETLAKLTGQNFSKFIDWQSWHNDHKGERWK